MYYNDVGTISIEREEQCYTCQHFTKEVVTCPLIQALGYGYVELANQFITTNCYFYSPPKIPKLKLVKKGDTK
jgi:hypothetical protein